MEHIKITTPENIEIEYLLAGAGSRIAAGVIDFTIQSIAFIILIIAMLLIGSNYLTIDNSFLFSSTSVSWTIAIFILLFFLIYYLYFIVSEMTMNGQSIGKRILGLRVIRDNGQPITLSQSLVRNLFRYFIDIYGVGVVYILFSKKCKRIGDMVASTIVINDGVKLKPNMLTLQDITQNNFLQQNSAFTNIMELSGDERAIVIEFMARKNNFIDNGVQCEEKLNSYFQNKYDMSLNDIMGYLEQAYYS